MTWDEIVMERFTRFMNTPICEQRTLERLEQMKASIAAFEAKYEAKVAADERENGATLGRLRRTSVRGAEHEDGCAAWFFLKPSHDQYCRPIKPRIDYSAITREIIGR